MIFKREHITDYLSLILHGDFPFSIDSLGQLENDEDQELLYGLVCLSEDLEYYRKNINKKLNNFKSTIFNSSAVAISNLKGEVIECNDAFSILTGYSKTELIGNNFSILKSANHTKDFFEGLWAKITNGDIWEGEIQNQKQNGEKYWIKALIFPMKDIRGEIQEFWSINQDITITKKLEKELIDKNDQLFEAIQSKELLMKEMHHRVKNNLQLIVSMLHIMQADNPDNEHLFTKIINRINSISSVHETLYKESENGLIELSKYLENIINIDNYTELRDIHYSINTDKIYLSADICTYLGIVLNELITNSFKHAWTNSISKKRREISLTCKIFPLHISVIYSDNGSGVQSSDKKNLGSMLIETLVQGQMSGELIIPTKDGYEAQIRIPRDNLQVDSIPTSWNYQNN